MMYPLDTTDSSFNFNTSSPFPSPTSDPFLPSLTEHVSDSSASPSLQSKSVALLPTQQSSFTPYLSHSLINQGNDSLRVAFLQERCNTLEQHLVKVMSERDTIKHLFDQLTNTIKIPNCDPSLVLNGNLPLPPLASADEKRPTRSTHPNVHFWTKTDYDDWLDSAEAAGSNRGLYAYLEDENGDVPKSETLGKIRRALRAGWRELGQRGMAPDTWGKASTSALQFIRLQIEKEFPLFKLADNGWKLEYICTKTYSAWRKHHLDDDGNLKRSMRDMIKEEALEDDNDLESHKPCSKKRKGPPDTTRPSNKKQKVDSAVLAPQPKATTPVHGRSPTSSSSSSVPPLTSPDIVVHVEPATPESPLCNVDLLAEAEGATGEAAKQLLNSEDCASTTLPAEAAVAQSIPQEVGVTLVEKSSTPVANSTDTSNTATCVPYNPMNLLALAAAKVGATTLPPVLAPSTKTPSNHDSMIAALPAHPAPVASGVDESKAGTQLTKAKAKLRPSGTKNGRNLCMLRWLKQVDTNGQKDDFRKYYDKTLMHAQREAYDKEAKQLIETNSWTKAIIERGILH
ncbi:hypothetical protein BKA83DRAFT_4395034 [Pisolithus microcarpus]|nr:hypothetical protein BKA83DRAFT_4395034 [Pisolithus microcarpus]